MRDREVGGSLREKMGLTHIPGSAIMLLTREGVMLVPRSYGPGTVNGWIRGMLSGEMTIKRVAAGVAPNAVGYAIVSQICKAAIELRKQGKRIELRIVDIEPGELADVPPQVGGREDFPVVREVENG